MTGIRSAWLICDAPGCDAASGDGSLGYTATILAARADARHDGWAFRAGMDYCPDHALAEAGSSEVEDGEHGQDS